MVNTNNNANSANASDSYNAGHYTLSFRWDALMGDLSVHKQWNISQSTSAITLDWGETVALYSFIEKHLHNAPCILPAAAAAGDEATDDIDLETET